MPASQVRAAFYDRGDFVGCIGTGPNFFFVAGSSWKAIRNATQGEIGGLKRLIGSPR
jgi:hypothetical protein